MSWLFIKKCGKTGIFEPCRYVFRIGQKALGSVIEQYSLAVQHLYSNFEKNYNPSQLP